MLTKKEEQEWLEKISHDSFILKKLPDDEKAADICMLAVKHDGYILSHMPKKFITKEICSEAVKNYKYALAYVPDEFKTEEKALVLNHRFMARNIRAFYNLPVSIKQYTY